jgi:hypothetical protein
LIRRARLRAIQGNVSAASKRAWKARRRRGREPSKEAAGQARAIVDDNSLDEPADSTGLIWNHFKFLTQGLPPRQSIDRQGLLTR